jgi:hypothetical protein
MQRWWARCWRRRLPRPAPGTRRARACERLRSLEQRNRLQDLSIDAQRRRQDDRLRAVGDPAARERTRQRWWREDRQTDFRREREREAIGRRVDAEERLERAQQRLPGSAPHAPAEAAASRAEFDRELREAEQRERLERLRRESTRTGPGARRWPR